MLALSTVYPVSSIENKTTSIQKQLTSDEHPVSRIEHSSLAERDRNSSPLQTTKTKSRGILEDWLARA
jgi:hypothetical protein